MSSTISTTTEDNNDVWGGGNKPLNASYGKRMMWFFIVSDALTFRFLAFGFSRFKIFDTWPIADRSFYTLSFLHGVDAPICICCFNDFYFNFFICNNGTCC